MTRSKIAAKYVNVVDRVPEGRPVPLPAFTVRQVRPTVPQHRVHAFVRELRAWFGESAMNEFDDRTVADLIAR